MSVHPGTSVWPERALQKIPQFAPLGEVGGDSGRPVTPPNTTSCPSAECLLSFVFRAFRAR
jgi:hypothetical protein